MLRSRLSAFLLSAALLLAQALALVHGVHHAGGAARATALAAAAGSTTANPAGTAVSRVDRLAGSHDGPVCRLIDQLAQADAPPCVAVLPVLALPPALPVSLPALVVPAAFIAVFQARGPPALR